LPANHKSSTLGLPGVERSTLSSQSARARFVEVADRSGHIPTPVRDTSDAGNAREARAVETTTNDLDIYRIRDDFPILKRQIHGKPLIYLDNAATTQKPRAVIDAIARFYMQTNANVHRGIHTLAEEATIAFEKTRTHLARFLNASRPEEIIFTHGTTEAINLVAASWGLRELRPGDEIILSELEHHANIVPWQIVASKTGARLRWLPLAENGALDIDAARAIIGPRTRIIAITQMSNVLGTITPVSDLAEMAHKQGALLLVDGAQSAAHMPIDVRALGCDFFALSAHKLLGPTGVGALYGRYDLLDAMEPYQVGGGMIERVTKDCSTWAEPPARFEAGTPNIADVVAFDTALDYLDTLGMHRVRAHDQALTALALEHFSRIEYLTCFGPKVAAERGGIFAFTLKEVHPHDLATFLDAQGIAIRAGHHCAQPLHHRLGIAATARASFAVYNTAEEIERLAEVLGEAVLFFR